MIYLLKNTMQAHRTCVRNHQFSNWNKKFYVCAVTLVDLYTKKIKSKVKKIFQTCTMNILEIFFLTIFFFCKKKTHVHMFTGHTRNFTLHWLNLREDFPRGFCFTLWAKKTTLLGKCSENGKRFPATLLVYTLFNFCFLSSEVGVSLSHWKIPKLSPNFFKKEHKAPQFFKYHLSN